MSYKRSFPSNSRELLLPYLKRAQTADELRRVQCVWLRVTLELDPYQIALAIGWSVNSVRQFHSRFLHSGEQVLTRAARGGRRNENLSFDAEAELVLTFLNVARHPGFLDVSRFQHAYERKVQHAVAKSTIYRILSRHGATSTSAGIAASKF